MRRRAVFGVGVVVAAALVLSVSAGSAGTPRGLIAFTRSDGIYVMRDDGSGVRALRRGGAAWGALGLAWSPDGRRLAFVSPSSERGGIWVMDADGTNLTRLVGAEGVSALTPLSPTWSPDGSRIAFTRRGYDDRDIWVMNADGSRRHRIARTPHRFEFEVDWSPVSNRIAFSDVAGLVPRAGVIDTNGGRIRMLTSGFESFSMSPQWSPDGRRIAFLRWQGPYRNADIYVADPDGGSQVQLTDNRVPESGPAWSPDGRRIVFVRLAAETPWSGPCVAVPPATCGRSDLYVINADGTGLTRLTHTAAAEGSPAWKPVS